MKDTGSNLFFYVLEAHVCLQPVVVNYTEGRVFFIFSFFFHPLFFGGGFLVHLHIFYLALLDVVACCLRSEWFI